MDDCLHRVSSSRDVLHLTTHVGLGSLSDTAPGYTRRQLPPSSPSGHPLEGAHAHTLLQCRGRPLSRGQDRVRRGVQLGWATRTNRSALRSHRTGLRSAAGRSPCRHERGHRPARARRVRRPAETDNAGSRPLARSIPPASPPATIVSSALETPREGRRLREDRAQRGRFARDMSTVLGRLLDILPEGLL